MIETITAIAPKVLREMVAAGSVDHVRAISGGVEGLVVLLRAGPTERVVGAARGGPRYFKSVDGVISTLKDYGINKLEVDASGWMPRTKTA